MNGHKQENFPSIKLIQKQTFHIRFFFRYSKRFGHKVSQRVAKIGYTKKEQLMWNENMRTRFANIRSNNCKSNFSVHLAKGSVVYNFFICFIYGPDQFLHDEPKWVWRIGSKRVKKTALSKKKCIFPFYQSLFCKDIIHVVNFWQKIFSQLNTKYCDCFHHGHCRILRTDRFLTLWSDCYLNTSSKNLIEHTTDGAMNFCVYQNFSILCYKPLICSYFSNRHLVIVTA